jgi:hypothetical protein
LGAALFLAATLFLAGALILAELLICVLSTKASAMETTPTIDLFMMFSLSVWAQVYAAA